MPRRKEKSNILCVPLRFSAPLRLITFHADAHADAAYGTPTAP